MQKLIFVLFVVFGSCLAFAHQPLWNPGSSTPLTPFVIDEVDVSKAIFGELKDANVAHFVITVPNNFDLDVGIFRGGQCEEAFLPELWVLREGKAGDTPFESLANFEGVKIEGNWSSYQGHGLVGFKGAEYKEKLKEGTYSIVVHAPQGEGMYLLSLGGLERWGSTPEGLAAIPRFNRCG